MASSFCVGRISSFRTRVFSQRFRSFGTLPVAIPVRIARRAIVCAANRAAHPPWGG